MQWQVVYNPRGETWELSFPPQYMSEDEIFHEWETMAEVLAMAIENWLSAS